MALLGVGSAVSFASGDQRAEFAHPVAMLLREVVPLTRIRGETAFLLAQVVS